MPTAANQHASAIFTDMKNKNIKSKSTNATRPDLYLSLFLILYVLVPVITPDFGCLDSNGPKFLMLAVLNLAAVTFIALRKGMKATLQIQTGFFNTLTGLAYTTLLLISLLSVVKAVNLPESILQLSKAFTIFCSACILILIIKKDSRHFTQIIIVLTCVLIVDCLTVFYNIIQYIDGSLPSIMEIKSVYSNKNILASAIFVKIPFALWLVIYGNEKMKTPGLIALFFAVLATLLMSTRAFYLGLFFLTIVMAAFLVIRYIQSREKVYPVTLVKFMLVLGIAFSGYAIVQKYFYPKQHDTYNVSVTQRLATISATEGSAATRLGAWKNSLNLIRENPLLGVGTGNWKIVDVRDENRYFSSYQYMYKNHNDFLETTAETGVFGGLAFLFIFLFTGLDFVKTLFGKKAVSNLKFLFIPAFGLLSPTFPGSRVTAKLFQPSRAGIFLKARGTAN